MKALKFYKELKESEPSTSSRESNPQFSASTGWLTGFIKRHSFHNLKIKGEVASADEEAARKYPEKLAKIIKDGGYCAHQIFNVDEAGLFWKKMPTRTYIAKSEKNASGFKAAKDRVTLLLCSNASGDRMLKPLLVNRSLKPRALKGKDLNTLPVHWMANKKAWVTTAIFTEWFNKCFVPEVENYMKEMGLEFKILLILDNAPGGEGFDDFGEHDIEELLVDEALNDDDILENSELEDVTPLDEKLLREGLQLSGKLEIFFIQNDNDVERALKFQRNLKFCMSGYRELYKELVKPSQRLITDYLVKEKKITEVPKEALPCRSDDVILSSSDESDLAPIHKRLAFISEGRSPIRHLGTHPIAVSSAKDCPEVSKWLSLLTDSVQPGKAVGTRMEVASLLLRQVASLRTFLFTDARSTAIWHCWVTLAVDDDPDIRSLVASTMSQLTAGKNSNRGKFLEPVENGDFRAKSAHLREVLLFAFNWKKSATEAHRMLEEVYGDHALSKSQCNRWFKKFQSGDFELDNEPHGKPHQKFEDAELQALLDKNSTQTQEKLSKQIQVSQGGVSLRLNSLRMTQKLSRWVPHELSERQQERRLVTCEGLFARHEKKSFLHRIVTSDEKSIPFSNPMRQKSWGLLGQFPKQSIGPIA
ncbi:hypothetical protein LAZ67_16002855 [Cordylochernes scorpioides]|uniref:HTH CENPB-type domain-containing protein n=1 Tax=Cordylochernes scorpioides TaxID=51811 RepID=A0ABY6LCA1_9ARAC|nr:hypothetical protein LAZ67_16002855 [Cordylochernes scorpioides]